MDNQFVSALVGGVACLMVSANAASAQTQPGAASGSKSVDQQVQTTQPPPAGKQPPASASPEKETWQAPFGGSWTASFAFATDFSYRGISLSQRQVAGQASVGYETAPVSEKVPLSAYVGAWGSSIYLPNTPTWADIHLLAGLRLKALEGKLTFDLGYTRYNYLGAPGDLFFDFNEFSLVAGYDFGFVQLSAAVRYSPNFFANSGIAWYKWGQAVVPLSFINFNENITFKVFGTVGNQYVERFINYGIGTNNYWDWQVGIGATVYGFDLSVAYVATNLAVGGCGNTMNCDARALFTVSKMF
jgi:uncharacterized protein (TIGR02001 family)